MQLSVSDIEKTAQAIRNKADKVRNISGKVTFAELFTKEFMNKYTKFDSISDLLGDCGFTLKSPEDFNEVKSGAFDAEISSRTEFSGWDEMEKAAVREYIAKKIKS